MFEFWSCFAVRNLLTAIVVIRPQIISGGGEEFGGSGIVVCSFGQLGERVGGIAIDFRICVGRLIWLIIVVVTGKDLADQTVPEILFGLGLGQFFAGRQADFAEHILKVHDISLQLSMLRRLEMVRMCCWISLASGGSSAQRR